MGRKIDVIFNRATTVVVGNAYLAERARQAGARRVMLVPTTVDHRAYAEQQSSAHDKLTFGWIGSSATAQYLQTIAPELDELCHSLSAQLRLIGVDRHQFKCPDVVLSNWSEDTELKEVASCDIGLAPMSDGHWERGKCGLKAIQYMAIGIPVLAADVGVLPTIVHHWRDWLPLSQRHRVHALCSPAGKRTGIAAPHGVGWQKAGVRVLLNSWLGGCYRRRPGRCSLPLGLKPGWILSELNRLSPWTGNNPHSAARWHPAVGNLEDKSARAYGRC